MNYHESAEDYLERILMLNNKIKSVRSIDIATDMNYSKASVSIAMKKLKEKGYIHVDQNGFITLTEEGYNIAISIYDRHKIITKALLLIGVNEETAKIDACKIEHNLSNESYLKLKEYIEKSSQN